MKKRLLVVAGVLTLSAAAWAQELKLSVNEKSKVGYTDTDGKLVIKQIYDSGTAFQNGYAKVMKGKKYGFIDATGKETLPIKYDDIQEWGNGLYLASSGNTKALVKSDGTIVLDNKLTHISKPNMYGKAWIASGGKAVKNVLSGGKFGIINADGKVIVQPQNKGMFEFSRQWDKEESAFGKSLIPTSTPLNIGDTLKTDCKYIIVSDNAVANMYGALIDGNTGTELIPKKTCYFMTLPQSGMVRYYAWDKKTTTCGYYDIENKKDIKIKTINTNIDAIKTKTHGNFTKNIALINDDGTWAFVDRQGNKIISGIKKADNGETAEVWSVDGGDGVYLIDYDGNKLLGGKTYQSILLPQTKEDNAVFAVKENGKWALADAAGNAKTEFIYDKACAPKYGWTMLAKNDKYGIVDADGKAITDFIADDMALLTKKDPQYLWIKQNGLYYNYDIKNKTTGKIGYENVVTNLDNGYALVRISGTTVTQDALTRILLGQDADKLMDAAVFADNQKYFGNIVDTKDNVYFPQPITILFWDKAMEAIKANGDKQLTRGQAKQKVLEWTKDKRSYPLGEAIGEDNWDY